MLHSLVSVALSVSLENVVAVVCLLGGASAILPCVATGYMFLGIGNSHLGLGMRGFHSRKKKSHEDLCSSLEMGVEKNEMPQQVVCSTTGNEAGLGFKEEEERMKMA